jgi:tetratricopeptide (TPR) repeat protein
MKRLLLAVLVVAGVAAFAYVFTETRRERVYRQLVVDGDHALARGDTFAAVTAFTEAIRRRPDSMLGYLKRGEAHRRRGDLPAASADLRVAAELDPAAPQVLELLGDVERERESFAQAAEHYLASVRLDDRAPRVLYKLGLARHVTGETAAAVDALGRAVALDARFAEAHYLLGVCLRDAHRPRDAEYALRRAIALAPRLLAAREQLAELYASAGRRAERIAELEQLHAADPRPARAGALALAYAAAGQPARAVRLLQRTADQHPDEEASYSALGRVWLDVAQADADPAALERALGALEQAAAIEPSGRTLAELGRARLTAGQLPAAERDLRDAADALPVDPVVFLHLADAAERNGRPQLARRALLDYAALNPGGVPRHGLGPRIARLSMQLGEPAVAVRWYAAALEARPVPSLLARYAEAQWAAGDRAGARATLARLLAREPDNPDALALDARFR